MSDIFFICSRTGRKPCFRNPEKCLAKVNKYARRAFRNGEMYKFAKRGLKIGVKIFFIRFFTRKTNFLPSKVAKSCQDSIKITIFAANVLRNAGRNVEFAMRCGSVYV